MVVVAVLGVGTLGAKIAGKKKLLPDAQFPERINL